MLTKILKRKKSALLPIGLLLCLALALLLPSAAVWGQSSGDLVTEQPVLLVTGDGVIAGGIYSAANVSNEKSYTLVELKNLGSGYVDERLYSSLNSVGTKRIYIGAGVDAAGLLALSGYNVDNSGNLTFVASDGYTANFTALIPLNAGRLCYPNFGAASGETDGAKPVAALLAWKNDYVAAPGVPVLPAAESSLRLLVGQTAPDNINNSLFNQNVNQIRAGSAITEKALTVLGKSYTRAETLMMPRAEHAHTSGTKVRGVPLAEFLQSLSGDTVIEFASVDNWANIPNYTMTKSELLEKNAILAYETRNGADTAWDGYYRDTTAGPGYFRLWVDGLAGAHAVNAVNVKPTEAASPYKHITNGGAGGIAPYNIDALTSATLTVEGPGVVASTPISVRELESTADTNIHRGVYSDNRGSGNVNFSYEGVKLRSILDGQVNATVERLDDEVVVVFKNRWRQEIGRATYQDIKNAGAPLIMAYGSASADGITLGPAPFVFNNAAGIIGPPLYPSALGNDDGPLKLAYDQSQVFDPLNSHMPTNAKFASVAYLYIEEGTPPPGFKHKGASDTAYNNAANTEHIITFTGSALGREVNYTVAELEDMVEYDGNAPKAGGVGYRAEYGLSNTTYWYVNEYEGVKVWDLLTRIGIDAATYKDDADTFVSFAAWDNWDMATKFSMKQLADPDLFYFYEKSPLDIGSENRPTKAQLATTEYHPDNQVGNWQPDHNGYPVMKGYPVMLAYGVNGYPYVRENKLPGFKSGLGNDGGPMRVIYGKADGLTNAAPEDYAYFFNNGSKQLKAVQEVYVGEEIRYSTHQQNPHSAYQAMKDIPDALKVEVISDGETIKNETFTLAELENILYSVSKSIRDSSQRQEKGYYFYRSGDIQDLFEGVSLEYLLTTHIGMPGVLGSVELYSGTDLAATYDLAAIGDKGYNSLNGASGLGMMVAFAKNGYPLVAGGNNSSNTNPGYVDMDPIIAGRAIKNGGGPLLFARGQTEAEYNSGSLGAGAKTPYVSNLTKIVVRLEADPFAHVGAAYASYANQTVRFSGAVALGGVDTTVGALETKQRYMVTGGYTVGGVSNIYRGLDLYALLRDDSILASNMMDAVTVKNSAGQSKVVPLSQLTASGKKIILAYGMASASDLSDAAPLITASGGPMRLIIEGGSAADCITNVSEIEVSRAEQGNWWKHDSGVYLDYTGPAYDLEVSGKSLKYNKTFTVAELEAMEDIFVSDHYSAVDWYVQGVDLYKLLLTIGIVEDADITVKAIASDNYTQTFTASQVRNGAGDNGKPILIAFGRGNKSGEGLPLVPSDGRNSPVSPGYVSEMGNSGGPLRLLPDTSGGNSVQRLVRIVVGEEGGNPDPSLQKDFNISGLKGGAKGYSIDELKNLPDGMGIKTATYSYTSGGAFTDEVKGAYLYDILINLGVSDAGTVTVNTTDSYENSQADYRDIPMSTIKDQDYFVAYEAGSNGAAPSAISDQDRQTPPVTATVRIYRNFNDGSNWRNRLTNIKGVTVTDYSFNLYPGGANGMPIAQISSVVTDSGGGTWVGSAGGGAAYIAPTGALTSYTTTSAPALMSDTVTVIAIDKHGVVWLSQGGTGAGPGSPADYQQTHQGLARFENGAFTFFNRTNTANGLPNNRVNGMDVDDLGNVWLATTHNEGTAGTFYGGITKYNTINNTWQTWSKNGGDKLPTASTWAVKADGQGGAWVTSYRSGTFDTDPPDISYVYINAAGTVISYDMPPGTTTTHWSYSAAIDSKGGVYIARLSGDSDTSGVKGRLDYIAPGGNKAAYTYTSSQLIPASDMANTTQGLIKVFVDAEDNVWLCTDGAGVYCFAAADGILDTASRKNYSSKNGSWPAGPFDSVWSLYVSDDGKAVFGSNGGVAWAKVDIKPPTPTVTVLDPPFTIKQGGKPDITWAIGGSGSYDHFIKSLANDAGRVEKSFTVNGQNITARGAALSAILTASGISGDNLLISITTTDSNSAIQKEEISLDNITTREYFLAYDIKNASSGDWDKIADVADVDEGKIQASLRIYRKNTAGAVEEIRHISGLTISVVNPGDPNDTGKQSVGDATTNTAELKITGAVAKDGFFTIAGLKTYPGVITRTRTYNWQNSYGTTGKSTMTGVYLDDLLRGVMTLSPNAESITVTAKDGYYSAFSLDSKSLGVYWTDNDGNKLMLAWEGSSGRGEVTPGTLRLIVGQTGSGHVNLPMWVSDVVSITVNTGPPPPPPPPRWEPDPTAPPTEATLTLKANVKVENGVALASNTADEVHGVLKAYNDSAGQAATLKVLRIDATTKETTVKTTYSLPADALQVLIEDGFVHVELIIDQGSLMHSAELLKYLDDAGQGALILDMEAAKTEEKEDLAAVDITIRRGDTVVSSFNDMLLKADIPFSPAADQRAEGLVVYHADGDGQKTLIKLTSFNREQKSMRIGLTHLSKYVIGYNPLTFADIQGHWGKSSIEFLASRHIVNGRSADTFAPDGQVTRAEFLKMLAEAVDGIKIADAANAAFSDVPNNAWYADYVNWAAGLGIAQGLMDGTFRPDALITREQMAAMTERFIRAIKYDIKATQNAAEFTDQKQISAYATAAIKAMQQYGIMQGNPDNSFNPKGTATRAEAAKVIHTFIEAVLR